MALSPVSSGVWSTPEPISWQLADGLRSRGVTQSAFLTSEGTKPNTPATQLQSRQSTLSSLWNLLSQGQNANSALGDLAKGVAALAQLLSGSSTTHAAPANPGNPSGANKSSRGHTREAAAGDPRPNFLQDASSAIQAALPFPDASFALPLV